MVARLRGIVGARLVGAFLFSVVSYSDQSLLRFGGSLALRTKPRVWPGSWTSARWGSPAGVFFRTVSRGRAKACQASVTKSVVILLQRERFMHMQDEHRAAFLDRQSLGAVIFSTMLTIALVAPIYIGFVAP